MDTIISKYEKFIDPSMTRAWILTGLLLPCSCDSCSKSQPEMNRMLASYQVGRSNYYILFRHGYSFGDSYYSIYVGCPKSNGRIIFGGMDEVFDELDELDKEIFIFNINLFSK